ncbi:MAG: radical SAM protein [Bacilli bacterium]
MVAFTVSECVLMSRVSGKSLGEVIDMLVEAGVNALPGGGAEIFDESVRKKISPNKLTASEWLGAMQIAHEHSLRTNATMLYGHIETPESVIDHLFKLRDQQDKSGGFKAFVPLPFRKGASDIESKGSGVYDLKICAIARLVLDNFAHIRVPIPHFGDRMAQILLNFGADDIGGTHWHEEVAAAAGAARSNRTEDFMRKTIIAAGFNPVKGTSIMAFKFGRVSHKQHSAVLRGAAA